MAELDRVVGPTIPARAALEPTRDWDALRRDLVDLFASNSGLADGAMLVRCEY